MFGATCSVFIRNASSIDAGSGVQPAGVLKTNKYYITCYNITYMHRKEKFPYPTP